MSDSFGGYGGGGFGGPLDYRRLRDPRYAYAQALAKGAGDTSPTNAIGALSRIAQGAISGYMLNKTEGEWKDREGKMASAYAEALKAMQGTPGETKNYTNPENYQTAQGAPMQAGAQNAITWDPVKPDFNRGIAIMGANPDLAGQAAQLGIQNARYQQQRGDQRADTEQQQAFTLGRDAIQNEYGTARDNLNRAHQEFMQDRSAGNAMKLQEAQQRFQGAENAATRMQQERMQGNAQQFQLNSAGPIAKATASGTLAAQLDPVANPLAGAPNQPPTVPAGAAVKIATEGMTPTEGERTATGYANRMAAQAQALAKIGEGGFPSLLTGGAPAEGQFASWAQRVAQSPEQQQYMYAAMDWIRAKLRKESGAAIGEKEAADEWRTYFPMPGDTQKAIQDKARARAQAEQEMAYQAGRSYRPNIVPGAPSPATAPVPAPPQGYTLMSP